MSTTHEDYTERANAAELDPYPNREFPRGKHRHDFTRTHSESRPLAVEFAKRAAEDLRTAKERLRIANERRTGAESSGHVAGNHDRLWLESEAWEQWINLLVEDVSIASRRIMEVILLFNGQSGCKLIDKLHEMENWPGAALVVDGDLYTVGPDDDYKPVLTVVESARIAGDTDGEPEWDDADEDADEDDQA